MSPGSTEPGALLDVDEYKEIAGRFPRWGFKNDLIGIMCGLCRDKPETVYDNFVGEFGAESGLDGKGGSKEEFSKVDEERRGFLPMLLRALNRPAEWEACDMIISSGRRRRELLSIAADDVHYPTDVFIQTAAPNAYAKPLRDLRELRRDREASSVVSTNHPLIKKLSPSVNPDPKLSPV